MSCSKINSEEQSGQNRFFSKEITLNSGSVKGGRIGKEVSIPT